MLDFLSTMGISALLISLLILVLTYIGYAGYKQKGIPESLSATYYLLGDKGWLTQAMFILTGIGLLPAWLNESTQPLQFLTFLSCGGLMFVGSAPMFRLPLQGAVHYISAVVCCVSAVLWAILSGYYPIVVCSAFLGFMGYVRWKQPMWWLEIAVIAMVFTSLL